MRKRKEYMPRKIHSEPAIKPKLTKTYLQAMNTLIPTVMLSATMKICFNTQEILLKKQGHLIATLSSKNKKTLFSLQIAC